jgi:hypothetical protein
LLEQKSDYAPTLWKTTLAVVISVVLASVVSSFVSIVLGLIDIIFRGYGEWLSDIWEQVVGGVIGVYAARRVCDRYLEPYSKHVVFVVISIGIVSVVISQYYLGYLSDLRLITQSANAIATCVSAYFMFWRGTELPD